MSVIFWYLHHVNEYSTLCLIISVLSRNFSSGSIDGYVFKVCSASCRYDTIIIQLINGDPIAWLQGDDENYVVSKWYDTLAQVTSRHLSALVTIIVKPYIPRINNNNNLGTIHTYMHVCIYL